jgi:hypothetical protein
MIYGIQLIGIFFALFMLYLTYLYFKRDNYGILGFVTWFAVWSGFIILVSFPSSVYGIMQALKIERTADFIVAAALMFFSILIFKLYNNNKVLSKKLEDVVRKVSIISAEKEYCNSKERLKNKK